MKIIFRCTGHDVPLHCLAREGALGWLFDLSSQPGCIELIEAWQFNFICLHDTPSDHCIPGLAWKYEVKV